VPRGQGVPRGIRRAGRHGVRGPKATLFSIDATGDKDDKGRRTYTINNAHGFVQ
jgi:hypothetical protein